MKTAIVFSWLCTVAMVAALLNGFINGSFGSDGALLLANPWGIVSIIDLYAGFILFSLWIFFREEKTYKAVVWTILMMTFGFLTGSIYVLINLYRSNSDWKKFFMGARYNI
jgi:hypothetical protein